MQYDIKPIRAPYYSRAEDIIRWKPIKMSWTTCGAETERRLPNKSTHRVQLPWLLNRLLSTRLLLRSNLQGPSQTLGNLWEP